MSVVCSVHFTPCLQFAFYLRYGACKSAVCVRTAGGEELCREYCRGIVYYTALELLHVWDRLSSVLGPSSNLPLAYQYIPQCVLGPSSNLPLAYQYIPHCSSRTYTANYYFPPVTSHLVSPTRIFLFKPGPLNIWRSSLWPPPLHVCVKIHCITEYII